MRLPLLAAWLSLVLACAHAPASGPGLPRVRSFRIEGAHQLDPEFVKSRLVTRDTYEPVTWQGDLQRIVRVYQSEGYYDAVLTDRTVTRNPDGTVDLSVTVNEGVPVKLTGIVFTGLERLPPEEKPLLLEGFPLVQGQIVREASWQGLTAELQRRLEDAGYAEARVQGELRVLPENHEAKAFLDVKPGQKYRIGEIVVVTQPTPKVGTQQIIAEAGLAAKKGELFSRQRLDDVQARVFRLGVFDAVEVAPGTPNHATGTIDILVDIRELPLHEVRVGGGLGIEPAQSEVHAFGEYVDSNFGGGLRKLRIHGMGGYAFVPDLISVATDHAIDAPSSGPIGRLELSLEEPEFLAPGVRGYVSLGGARRVEQSYEDFEANVEGGVVWQPSRPFSLRAGVEGDVYRLEAPVPLDAQQRRVLFGCADHCHLTVLRERAQWDKRDDRLDPKRGYYLAIDLRESLAALSSAGFFQVEPQARGYLTFGDSERYTLGGRLLFGAAVEGDQPIPIVARFFSGGSEQMRGFSYQRLSPMLVVPRENVGPGEPTGVARPVGGNGLFEASLELRDRITQSLTAAVFSDLGSVTPGRLEFGSGFADTLQWAVGVGLRWRTPLGPLRVDLAYRPPVGSPLPVAQLPGLALTYPVGSGCFGIGTRTGAGAPEGACSVHVSIGESF